MVARNNGQSYSCNDTGNASYWANSSRVKHAMGVLDARQAGNHGLLFFDTKLQEAYKGSSFAAMGWCEIGGCKLGVDAACGFR